MDIHGEYINRRGERIRLYIRAGGAGDYEIGDKEGAEFYFTANAITIRNEANDLFDVMRRKSAEINLLCRNWHPELFSLSVRSAVVNIYIDSECVFAGFVEPQVYKQPYNSVYDTLSIHCVDLLTALNYSRYGEVTADDYHEKKQRAGVESLAAILKKIIRENSVGLDILNGRETVMYEDESVRTLGGSCIFTNTYLTELLFFDDSTRDMWRSSKVVEEILKYLNLHIIQRGFDLFVFSWQSLKAGGGSFKELGGVSGKNLNGGSFDITEATSADCDTELEVHEAYNRFGIVCHLKREDDIFSSPFDRNIAHVTERERLAMSEYKFVPKIDAEPHSDIHKVEYYDTVYVRDWFFSRMRNDGWSFRRVEERKEEQVCDMLFNLQRHSYTAAMFVSRSEKSASRHSQKVSTGKTRDIVISVNGTDVDYPRSPWWVFMNRYHQQPILSYKGNRYANLSSADPSRVNYIVFKGSMLLEPVAWRSFSYSQKEDDGYDLSGYSASNQPFEDGYATLDSACYYRYDANGRAQVWKAKKDEQGTAGTGEWDYTEERRCFAPPSPDMKPAYPPALREKGARMYVPLLVCQLVIGDKVLTQRNASDPTSFHWEDYEEKTDGWSEEEARNAQTFTLGVELSESDMLVGKELKIYNNITPEMGVSGNGTAIPIPSGSHVSGKVRFSVLGVSDPKAEDVDGTLQVADAREVSSGQEQPIIPHVSNIFIRDFELTLGKNEDEGEKEDADTIHYRSANRGGYENEKDGIEFYIHSALTGDEIEMLGANDAGCLSVALSENKRDGVKQVFSAGNIAKPEQLYLNAYHDELSRPKIELKQRVFGDKSVTLWDKWRSQSLGRDMYVQGYDLDLSDGEATLYLREM